MFDSGVGGLSIARAVRELMPKVPITYVSDSAWFPYGMRSRGQIAERSETIARYLIERGARVIVVACNTASNAAIVRLRKRFDLPFVGIEPAVKVASDSGTYRRVGVLCTIVTAGGPRYQHLLNRVAQGLEVFTVASRHLAGLVEQGGDARPEAGALVAQEIKPLLDAQVEVIVLGCTHYAFLADLIQRQAGVPVLEPSMAVARQVQRVYPTNDREPIVGSSLTIQSLDLHTTGPMEPLREFVERHRLGPATVTAVELG